MMKLTFHSATPGRWRDIETLFGERGACAGCWCMYWRRKRSVWEKQKGAGNKQAFKKIVRAGPPPGVLGYAKGEPVGWCAIAPRASNPVLGNSRVLKPVDEQRVWSVTCLFIRRDWRRKGLSSKLIGAAAALAKKHGARLVEGYPTDPKGKRQGDAFVWTGLVRSFEEAGFVEVARRSPARPIMRKKL
jgi:GNAT superfamily N-acetyltransferase